MPAKKTTRKPAAAANRKQKITMRAVAKAVDPTKNYHKVFAEIPGVKFPVPIYFPLDKACPNEITISIRRK